MSNRCSNAACRADPWSRANRSAVASVVAKEIAELPQITGSVAGWLLRSIERDLIDDCRRARRARDDLAVGDPTGDAASLSRYHSGPSAEEAAFAGPLVWGALADATRSGAVSSASARVVVLHAAGHSLPEVARRAGTSRASIYRLRDRAHAQLRGDLAVAS